MISALNFCNAVLYLMCFLSSFCNKPLWNIISIEVIRVFQKSLIFGSISKYFQSPYLPVWITLNYSMIIQVTETVLVWMLQNNPKLKKDLTSLTENDLLRLWSFSKVFIVDFKQVFAHRVAYKFMFDVCDKDTKLMCWVCSKLSMLLCRGVIRNQSKI